MSYASLLIDWGLLARVYPGWTLEEIKSLSNRERKNWLELAKGFQSALKGL